MTEIKHFCDKCGERIAEGRTLLANKAGPHRLRRPQVDLCGPCYEEFDQWLSARVDGSVAPRPIRQATMIN
jgi:hypothetical protein